MDNSELVEYLKHDYLAVRVLPDGSVAALGDLMFTRAIHLGCNRFGFAQRFCFENRDQATDIFNSLQTEDDEPTGYIARRP